MPANPEKGHVIRPRQELHANRPVDGVIMRDWLASVFTTPESAGDHGEEGTLVAAYPGVRLPGGGVSRLLGAYLRNTPNNQRHNN